MITLALVLPLLAVGAERAPAQVARFLPVDEAVRDPSLFVFRARLLESLARWDTAAVMAVVSPRIKNSFGGDGGRDEFRSSWQLERLDSPLWPALSSVLALGGSFPRRQHVPGALRLQPLSGGAGRVRAPGGCGQQGAGAGGAGLDLRCHRELVVRSGTAGSLAGADADECGSGALEAGGNRRRSNRLPKRYLRSPIDYRAAFSRRGSGWEMILFLAGD
jgi:hypothetical protein